MPDLLTDNLLHLGLTAGAVIALLIALHVQERAAGHFLAHRLGWRSVLLTGWLGVPLHELSHLAAAWLFGHRIIAWRLFDPDPATGTLGYVRHAYRRRNPWQLAGGFFIGVAPAAAGGTALAVLLWWMLPQPARAALPGQLESLTQAGLSIGLGAALRTLAVQLGTAIWSGRSALLPVQLYVATCVTSHMAPSRADLTGALPGGLLVAVLLAGGAAAAALAGRAVAPVGGIVPPLVGLVAIASLLQGGYVALVALAGRLQSGRGPSRQPGRRSAGARP